MLSSPCQGHGKERDMKQRISGIAKNSGCEHNNKIIEMIELPSKDLKTTMIEIYLIEKKCKYVFKLCNKIKRK